MGCVLVVQACFGGGVLLSLLGVYLLSTQPPGAADDNSASDSEDDDAGELQTGTLADDLSRWSVSLTTFGLRCSSIRRAGDTSGLAAAGVCGLRPVV